MRGLAVILMAISACSFQHGSLPAGGGSVGDASVDAPPDAPGGVPVDGPCSDADHDGVCDAVDDWPCGAKPAAPPTTVMLTANGTETSMTLTMMAMGHPGSQMLVVTPGQALTFMLHYQITDTACDSGCIDQIEVGFIAGTRLGCVFDQTVPNPGGASGNSPQFALNAPATAGSYDFRAHIGQNYSCNYNGATGWWANSPPLDAATMVKVCVH